MVRKYNLKLASQLNCIAYYFTLFSYWILQHGDVFSFVYYVVYCLSYFLMYNFTASSVPSLSPSPLPLTHMVGRSHIVRRWVSVLENHRNSRVMLAALLFGSIRLSHNASSSELILRAVKEMQDGAWPMFSYRHFSQDRTFRSITVISLIIAWLQICFYIPFISFNTAYTAALLLKITDRVC